MVDFAEGLALGIKSKPAANIRKLTAGTAAETLPTAIFIDGQKSGYSPPEFGGPSVF